MSPESPAPRLSILVLGDNVRSHADTLLEHLAAFRRYSRHRVDYYNPRAVESSRHLDLSAYDVVVIHYSLAITVDAYLSPAFREQIRRFDGTEGATASGRVPLGRRASPRRCGTSASTCC